MKLNYKPVSGCSSHGKAVEAPSEGLLDVRFLIVEEEISPAQHALTLCALFSTWGVFEDPILAYEHFCVCVGLCVSALGLTEASSKQLKLQQPKVFSAVSAWHGCWVPSQLPPSSHLPELLTALHPSKVPKNTFKQKWKQGVPSISHLIVSNPWVIQTHY